MTGYRIPILDNYSWQEPVLSKSYNSPPSGSIKGDRYIVESSATGEWTGYEKYITYFDGLNWQFISILEGMCVHVVDENKKYQYINSDWQAMENFTTILKNKLDNIVDNSIILYNLALLGFKIAYEHSLTLFNFIDGFVDEYEDESGIDAGSSENILYDSSNDCYSPSKINDASYIDEDCSSLSAWSDVSGGSGTVGQETFDSESTFILSSGLAGSYSAISQNIELSDTTFAISIKLYHNALGALSAGDMFYFT